MSMIGKITIGLLSAVLVGVVLELLRRRKLNEEYCVWWIVVAAAMSLLAWNERFLLWITSLIGALVPVSTLTLISLVVMLFMLVFYSMKISVLTNQLKELAQHVALRDAEADELTSRGTDRKEETDA